MEDNDVVDLTDHFEDPFMIPCCPICDMPMDLEPCGLFKAHGSLVLGHLHCIQEVREELGV